MKNMSNKYLEKIASNLPNHANASKGGILDTVKSKNGVLYVPGTGSRPKGEPFKAILKDEATALKNKFPRYAPAIAAAAILGAGGVSLHNASKKRHMHKSAEMHPDTKKEMADTGIAALAGGVTGLASHELLSRPHFAGLGRAGKFGVSTGIGLLGDYAAVKAMKHSGALFNKDKQ